MLILMTHGAFDFIYRLYCGEQLDSTTGLYYLRARYMNPSTGTFISMDTYQGSTFDPITLHKYLYANANPVMNCDPTGNMAAALLLGGYASMDIEVSHDTWCLNVYRTLMASLNTSVDTYIVKNAIGLALISYATYLGGKLQTVILETQINNTLCDVLVGTSESMINNILLINSYLNSLLITVASELSDYWNNNNNNNNLHHIVPRKQWYAAPAREILRRVNIDIEDSINKVLICTKTHRAIHSATVQLLYCSWIDILLICSYSQTRTIFKNQENVKRTMELIKSEILLVDATIRFL